MSELYHFVGTSFIADALHKRERDDVRKLHKKKHHILYTCI